MKIQHPLLIPDPTAIWKARVESWEFKHNTRTILNHHNIIGKESFEKINVPKKGTILGKVRYWILKNQTRTNTILISSILNIYHENFESDKNYWKKRNAKHYCNMIGKVFKKERKWSVFKNLKLGCE